MITLQILAFPECGEGRDGNTFCMRSPSVRLGKCQGRQHSLQQWLEKFLKGEIARVAVTLLAALCQ